MARYLEPLGIDPPEGVFLAAQQPYAAEQRSTWQRSRRYCGGSSSGIQTPKPKKNAAAGAPPPPQPPPIPLRGFKDPQLPNIPAFMNQPYPLRALRTRNWGV
jgi:hypothetical protein